MSSDKPKDEVATGLAASINITSDLSYLQGTYGEEELWRIFDQKVAAFLQREDLPEGVLEVFERE